MPAPPKTGMPLLNRCVGPGIRLHPGPDIF